jgi:hypothetical protein
MSGLQRRWYLVVAAFVVAGGLTGGPAWAQTESGWSFLVTPQVWFTHVESNGFIASAPAFAGSGTQGRVLPFAAFNSDARHDAGVSPQGGIQVAAQKGRWTLFGAFQYVAFEVDDRKTAATDFQACIANGAGGACANIPRGFPYATEHLSTTRLDFDIAATYFIPDVIPDRLDLSVGGGFKFIYATTSRQFEPSLATFTPQGDPSNTNRFQALVPSGYLRCRHDDLSDCVNPVQLAPRVKTKDNFYGLTVPIGIFNHLSQDGRWLLPISISPFLGIENRDDQDVVYAQTADPTSVSGFRAKRLDGITFAYGGTIDVTLRWIMDDRLSWYAGMRGQYIKGHSEYLAYGPIVGMSIRFGGR